MRIALATVGTTGDVVPFAALARGLADAGHGVTAISWELHRGAFEATRATFVAAGPPTTLSDIAQTARQAASASPLDQVAVLRDFHLRNAAAHYRRLLELLPGHDLVLLHGIHSLAEAAARDVGLPRATAVFDPVLLPTASAPPAGMPSLGPFNRLGWLLLDRMLRRHNGPLRAALQAAGSRSARYVTMFRARSPLLHLVACSPTIAPPPPDIAPEVHFTGAWTDSSAPPPLRGEVESFLTAGSPPVVVAFGSMAAPNQAELMRAVVDGVRQAGQRLVVQGLPVATTGSDILAVGRVDHRALLRRAVAVMHHGGAGTTHAAAMAGVPAVVVPHVGDQPYWAERLHRLGAAPAPLPVGAVTAERVRDRIQAALSPGIIDGAARLGRSVTAENGVGAAVQLLESADVVSP